MTLYAPTAHRCGIIFLRALKDMEKQKVIKPELARKAEEVINEIAKAIPAPLNQFELGHMDEIERMVEEQERSQKAGEERKQ